MRPPASASRTPSTAAWASTTPTPPWWPTASSTAEARDPGVPADPARKLRLGAVEYFQADADGDLNTDDDRPFMFDLPFDGPMFGHEPGMPVHYDLHVWLYRHNPAGLFAMWNPRVSC